MLKEILQNPCYYITILLVMGIYISFFINEVPKQFLTFSNNILFKLLIGFIILINAQHNPMVAIALLIGWVLTLDQKYVSESKDAIDKVEKFSALS